MEKTREECEIFFKKPIEERRKISQKESQIKYFLKKVNLTFKQYNEIIEKQEGKCAICKIELNSLKSNNVHKDHNHRTNKFRGLLCVKCNHMIGLSLENIQILEKAIEYLQTHQ